MLDPDARCERRHHQRHFGGRHSGRAQGCAEGVGVDVGGERERVLGEARRSQRRNQGST